MLFIKLPPLCGGHGQPCDPQRLREHFVDVQIDGFPQVGIHLLKEGVHLHVLRVAGVEIVDVAVEDSLLHQGPFHVRAAFFPLRHHQEPGGGQGGDQPKIVRITGDDDEGIHIVLVVFLAGTGRQLDVHQGLILLYPFNHIVLHVQGGEFAEDAPGAGGVDIVKQNDQGNL